MLPWMSVTSTPNDEVVIANISPTDYAKIEQLAESTEHCTDSEYIWPIRSIVGVLDLGELEEGELSPLLFYESALPYLLRISQRTAGAAAAAAISRRQAAARSAARASQDKSPTPVKKNGAWVCSTNSIS